MNQASQDILNYIVDNHLALHDISDEGISKVIDALFNFNDLLPKEQVLFNSIMAQAIDFEWIAQQLSNWEEEEELKRLDAPRSNAFFIIFVNVPLFIPWASAAAIFDPLRLNASTTKISLTTSIKSSYCMQSSTAAETIIAISALIRASATSLLSLMFKLLTLIILSGSVIFTASLVDDYQ